LIVAESSSFSSEFPTSLSAHEVHIWCIKLEQQELDVNEFASMLSGEEKRRAERFHFDRDRKRFVIGRSVLRTILASYLHTEPDELEFSYGVYGKPYLLQTSHEMTIQFSLAHSHEVVLYALARECNVGVDVEYVREIPDIEQIGQRYFTKQENAVFRSLTGGRKTKAFFESWTRKEAYLKAIGTGFADEIPSVTNKRDLVGTTGWSIMSFKPDPDYVAALAIEGHDWHTPRTVRHVTGKSGRSRPDSIDHLATCSLCIADARSLLEVISCDSEMFLTEVSSNPDGLALCVSKASHKRPLCSQS
jgi:4'-phosphopantetheinyl transferase